MWGWLGGQGLSVYVCMRVYVCECARACVFAVDMAYRIPLCAIIII